MEKEQVIIVNGEVNRPLSWRSHPLLRKASHRGWGLYAVMATYCLLFLVQDYRHQMEDKMWPFVLAPLALFPIQLAYPTLLGWLLSITLLAALGALFLTDPFHN